MLHASNDFTVQKMSWFEVIRWNTVSVYETLGRLGVPLFLMLTGFLLLQPVKLEESIGAFFRKRWARIGLPFIFWGAVYFAWDFFVVHNINGSPITWGSIVQGILSGPYYQFWYLYLLVGLYLLTPVLRVFMAYANRSLIKYILVLWLIGTTVPPVLGLVTSIQLDSNVLLFTGYAGYFILGAFLATVRIRSRLVVFLTVLGVGLTVVGTYVMGALVGGGETYFFQSYFSPTLVLAAAGLFILLWATQKSAVQGPPAPTSLPLNPSFPAAPNLAGGLNPQETEPQAPRQSAGRKLLALISANTLGLFLFHVMVLETIQKGYLGFAINGNTLNSVVEVPLNTTIVLFVSLGILVGLKKVPGLSRLIG